MQRLKSRPQFQAVLAGRTIAKSSHFALHATGLGSAQAPTETLFPIAGVWLGAMVPKRWAKRAVTRNAIKRQIYNVGAQYEARLKPAAHVVRLRTAFDRAHFVSASSEALKSAVRAELESLFLRATSTEISSEQVSA